MRSGFSLVELSIVLVILGLLTGGILAGQSLIRASELRAVSTEYQRFVTASQTFRDKYMNIPGDFRDATRFWQRQQNVAHCVTNSGAAVNAAGTCDGNGNGTLQNAGAASQYGEIFTFWQQLALAGLLEGTYTGISGSGGAYHFVANSNSPSSKLSNAGWSTYYFSPYTIADLNYFEGVYGHSYIFGAYSSNSITNGDTIRPEEAWNIDTKLDDGKPGTGKVLAREDAINCHDMTPSAATAASTANYRLVSSTIGCSLMFINAF